MPCANCGKTREEHLSGLAFDGRFGNECSGYEEQKSPLGLKRICSRCGAPTKFYENFDMCLKCEAK